MKRTLTVLPLALALTITAIAGIAQETAAPTAEEIAAELSNPNTSLASLTLKTQFRWFEGDIPGADSQDSLTFLFQPSFPFPRENGDKVIFRPAFPILVDQPIYNPAKGAFDTKSGFGDIAFDLVYAPKSKGKEIVAVGLVSSLPVGASDLGTERLTLGPELLVGYASAEQVALFFPSHQWDVGGSGELDISLTTIQLGYTYLPGGGWNVGTVPILTYDWEASQWTIPLNLNLGKTVSLAGKPWKLSVEANYYVDRSDALGPDWMIGFNVTPVVQNYLSTMLNDILR
jgi:hypothetical protein